MSFTNEKQQFLKKPDKSLIQGIDKAILPLVNKINKNPDYYTTSSCSGRIILLPETGKKQEKVFLFVKHDSVEIKEIKNTLKNVKSKNIIYLKRDKNKLCRKKLRYPTKQFFLSWL